MVSNGVVVDSILPTRPDTRNQQMMVISQLVRQIGAMQSVDELFHWLATMLVQRLEGEAVLIWTRQAQRSGEVALELRTTTYKEARLPRFLIANHQMVRAAEYTVHAQQGYWVQPVHTMFSAYHAMMLHRYGLNFCCGYSFRDKVLLPPPPEQGLGGWKVATPLQMAVLFFLRFPPRDGLVPGVGYILEQALQMARTCRMLSPLPETDQLPVVLPPFKQQGPLWTMLDLVPHRVGDEALLKVSNPLAPTVSIAHKETRQLYLAIDNQKSLRELMPIARLNKNELYGALRSLLATRRVELYEPGFGGKRVDVSRVQADR